MTYEIKNKLLENIGEWAIDPAILHLVGESLPEIIKFYESKGVEDMAKPALWDVIEEPVKEVFTAPIFSEAFVKVLKGEIENIKQTAEFNPNADEDELRQIPEFILAEQAPEFYDSLMNVIAGIINPILLTIWGRQVEISHVQLANYNPKGKQKGAWHHDFSSDFTIVVPLNTGEYIGGGTEFYNRGIVPPLPNGHGLFFPGLTHLHRGLAVEEGDRYLMVFWLKVRDE